MIGELRVTNGRKGEIVSRDVVICDLDGTLALDDGRAERYLRQGNIKDWDGYYAACADDEPNQPVIDLLTVLMDSMKYDIWILSGRVERTREITEQWLNDYHVDYDYLIMRPTDCRTQDTELKLQWVQEYSLANRIAFVIEDRQRMVDAWRAAGFTTLQVAPGNF